MRFRGLCEFRAMAVAAAVVAPLLLVGCGAASEDGDAVTATDATTTTAVALPPDCSTAGLERDLGPLGYSACEQDWAAVMPRSYTDVCTDCESIWLARWNGTVWRLDSQCYAYTTLVVGQHGCSAVRGNFPTPDPLGTEPVDLPPADVACVIWGYNTLEENLAVTGCEPG